MKSKKRSTVKTIEDSPVAAQTSGGGLKSLFVELNGQLQSYLEALKTASTEQNSN